MSEPVHDIELSGCTPEPLMAYLKALGILRLISEQKDENARGWWKGNVFHLGSTLDADTLASFFLNEYRPTPIVVPWSGADFFNVDWESKPTTYFKTPTSARAIEAILCTNTPRLRPYRDALIACKAALNNSGIDSKEKMGKQKWRFIEVLRSLCDDPLLVEWIDCAAITGVDKFAPLLGSGGGSDGNTHFSDNFMQNLWDVLPDFNDQRQVKKNQQTPSVIDASRRQLHDTLFAIASNDRVAERTSSLYDSGAVGGPNATQGMERYSLSNPWDVIMALEGAICFAGTAARRLAAGAPREAVFPFQVLVSITGRDRLAIKEQTGSEVWLAIWTRAARLDELLTLLREGRLQCGLRPARSGVDVVRAISSLGVDRGIESFYRYAIIKGRVGGENYNTAASLGWFDTRERSKVDLLREIDPWLDGFRRAAGDKNAPPRFKAALCEIDQAIFDLCRYGGARHLQSVLIGLGRAEREASIMQGKVGQSKVILKPLIGLSKEWISQCSDGTPEFMIARALAGLRDDEFKIGPLRANLESVQTGRAKNGTLFAKWADKGRAVVWSGADLSVNMASVLSRRLMDADRQGCENLPLGSPSSVGLGAVAAFLDGQLDDDRIERLLWGLMLTEPSLSQRSTTDEQDVLPLPRVYALLKLLFLPRPLVYEPCKTGRVRARLLRSGEKGGIRIYPEPVILPLLRAGRMGQACTIAMRRLRSAGLAPMPHARTGFTRDHDWRELDCVGGGALDPVRLAAALLIPINNYAVNSIVHLVIRGDETTDEQTEAAALTHSEGDTPS